MERDKLLLVDPQLHTSIGWHLCKVCGGIMSMVEELPEKANMEAAP